MKEKFAGRAGGNRRLILEAEEPENLEEIVGIAAALMGHGNANVRLNAAWTLKNAAWHNGKHLQKVVSAAGKGLLERPARNDLRTRALCASALKNAAFHTGPHVNEIVSHVFEAHEDNSAEVRHALARAAMYAAEKSKQLTPESIEKTRTVLGRYSEDRNRFVAETARKGLKVLDRRVRK
ncbi:hypothetical protein HZC09_05040 [Candidatus Micrarchaeota archaeon]|nr:hypothetical protein [Candidatus Micrarchaeota archaeon]